MKEEYILYLCDGKQLCGFGEGCHLKGGPCAHTTKPENALNGAIKDRKELKERFNRIEMKNEIQYWEIVKAIVCEEMKKLRQMLDEKNIQWEDDSEVLSVRTEFPIWTCRTIFEYKNLKISVINGFCTYGGWHGLNSGTTEKENMGLLEIMIGDKTPIGWLKAEDIIKVIEEVEK